MEKLDEFLFRKLNGLHRDENTPGKKWRGYYRFYGSNEEPNDENNGTSPQL